AWLRRKLREAVEHAAGLRNADGAVRGHSRVVLGKCRERNDHGDAQDRRLLHHVPRISYGHARQKQDLLIGTPVKGPVKGVRYRRKRTSCPEHPTNTSVGDALYGRPEYNGSFKC